MKKYLVIAVDVTGWTEDEVGFLAGEMTAQTEKNEDHVEAEQVVYAEFEAGRLEEESLQGIINVGLGL